MKIFLLLLFLPLMGLGQKDCNCKYNIAFNLTSPNIDTIPVVIEYSDTSKIDCKVFDSASGDFILKALYKDVGIYWMRGYEVRAVTHKDNYTGVIDPYAALGFKPQEWNQYEHINYLDANKHPLPTNIIVWQVK